MRSSGGTNFELLLSVVVLTKSMIACFTDPSFHEGSGSAVAPETPEPADEAEGAGVGEQLAMMRTKKANIDSNSRRAFNSLPPNLLYRSGVMVIQPPPQ
jgi:hypothetical protein